MVIDFQKFRDRALAARPRQAPILAAALLDWTFANVSAEQQQTWFDLVALLLAATSDDEANKILQSAREVEPFASSLSWENA